ncbi:MAG: N-acetylmuramoyl-L-alanine amidase [Clostridiales bacterium]|nr:N-acetylmuramoyl-L-alanine amidase [Clostridiales bacterium]
MSGHRRRKHGTIRAKLYSTRHVLAGLACLAVILIVIAAVSGRGSDMDAVVRNISEESIEAHTPDYDVQLLTVNEYSRPGIALEEINGIVIHYTANPGTSAQANRDYFEGLKDPHETYASAHFVVGLEGEIIQCIPTAEIAYASNERNSDTIAIECCYENEDGSFNESTYESVVHLTAWLCARSGRTSDDVIRHYDITGKLCPLYYVENPEAWEQFLADVDDYLRGM